MIRVITAFVADLMFQTRIESVAENLDLQVRWMENKHQAISTDIDGLATLGTNRILVEKLTQPKTKLIIFDLGNRMIPWISWIQFLKTDPATRRIPVICFGSHVDVDTLKEARKIGADEVVARSRFVTALPELIQKHVHDTDITLLTETCKESLHPDAITGLEMFNQGDYFAAHEYLEEAWKTDQTAGRDLYQGMLQVSIAYYQISRCNYLGAVKMFQRARGWLEPLPDNCRGIDVAQFRDDANQVFSKMLELGPNRLNDFPYKNMKPVIWELY